MQVSQDMLDAINTAVKAVNPNAGTTTFIDVFLGPEFDEFIGVESLMKYGLDPLPPDVQARFEAKWEEKKPSILAELIRLAVDTEKKRMAGYDFKADSDDFLRRDSEWCAEIREKYWKKWNDGDLVDEPPMSGIEKGTL